MNKYRFHGGRVKSGIKLDFSINTNPLGPPPIVYRLIENNLNLIKYYPEEESLSIKSLYAKKRNIGASNIIFGNGAAELLFLFINTLRPQKIIIPSPSFSEYYIASSCITENIVLPLYILKKDEFILPLDKLNEYIDENTLVIIGNPNNPTGTLFCKHELLELLKFLNKKKSYLLVDEAFMDFVQREESTSLIPHIREYNNLFILRSFTKIFNIPGIRLGMGIGNPDIIGKLEQRRDPWSVNIFAQIIAENLINMEKFIINTKNYIDIERKYLYKILNKNLRKRSVKIFKTCSNFYLLKFPFSSQIILDFLIKKKIYVRDASNFYGLEDGFIRLAIKKREENLELVRELEKIIYI